MKYIYFTFWLALACIYSSTANAQRIIHPDFEKRPMTYRGFLISPAIEIETAYDDNVLVLEENEKSDVYTAIRPEIKITKEISRHQLGLELGSKIKRYLENQDENTEDINVVFDGNLEAYRSLNIPFKLQYQRFHQGRINRFQSSLTKEPQELHTFLAETGFIYKPNRLSIELLGSYRQFRAEDTQNILTGVVRPGEDRDTDYTTLKLTTSYDTGAWFTPEVTVVYEDVDDIEPTFQNGGFTGDERDNTVIRVLSGIRMDYKDILLGSIGIGYETRNYDSNSIDSIDAISFRGDIGFKITPKTLISLEAERATFENNEILSGITTTSARFAVRRELNSRLFLEGATRYQFFKFENSTREDDEYKIDLGLLYLLNKGLFLEGRVSHSARDSTQNGLSYDRNIILLNLRKEF